MFCGKCGNQIADGQRFCSNCGAPIDAEPAKTAPVAEAAPVDAAPAAPIPGEPAPAEPLQSASVPEQPYVPQDAYVPQGGYAPQQPYPTQQPYAQPNGMPAQPYGQPDANASQYLYQTTPAPKKPKKGLIIGSIAAAVVVIVGLIVALGFINGWFQSDKDRIHSLEKKTVHEVLSRYNDAMSSSTDKNAATDVTVEPGSYLVSLASGSNVDISWVDHAKLKIATDSNDAADAVRARLTLNDTEIACLDVLLDKAANTMLVGMGDLSSSFGKIDLAENGSSLALLGSSGLTMNFENQKATDLVEKYFALTVDSIDTVVKTNDTLIANGVSEKCTAYTYELTQAQIVEICKTILTTAKSDATLKEFIESDGMKLLLAPIIASRNGEEISIYDSFIESVDEALENLNNTTATDEVALKVVEYVSNNRINGISITPYSSGREMETLFFGVAHKGNDFGAELRFGNMTYLTGTGVAKGSVINGDFSIQNEGVTLANIKATDYDSKKNSGTIDVSLTEDAWRSMGVSSSIAPILSSGALQLKLDGKKTDINVTVAGQDLLSATISKSDRESLPLDTGVDTVEMDEWGSTININEVFNRLKEAGMPEEMLAPLLSSSAKVTK